MDDFCIHIRELVNWLNLLPRAPVVFADPGYRQDLETPPQPFVELYLVTEGTLELHVASRRARLRAGDLALANAHFGNHGHAPQKGPMRYGCVSFELPPPRRGAGAFAAFTSQPLLLARRGAELEPLSRALLEVARLFHGPPGPYRDILLKAALLNLLISAGTPGRGGSALPDLRHECVRRAVECMLERRSDPQLSLGELARFARVSPSHLARLFKADTGMSPMRYLARYRIDHARRLLERSPLSIKEVAALVGFDDQLYFSRVFRRETGMAPSQYRARTA